MAWWDWSSGPISAAPINAGRAAVKSTVEGVAGAMGAGATPGSVVTDAAANTMNAGKAANSSFTAWLAKRYGVTVTDPNNAPGPNGPQSIFGAIRDADAANKAESGWWGAPYKLPSQGGPVGPLLRPDPGPMPLNKWWRHVFEYNGEDVDDRTAAGNIWNMLRTPEARAEFKQKMYYGGLYGEGTPTGGAILTPADVEALTQYAAVLRFQPESQSMTDLADFWTEAAMQNGGLPITQDPAEAYMKSLLQRTENAQIGITTENNLRKFALDNGISFNDDLYKKWGQDVIQGKTTDTEIKQAIMKNYVIPTYPAWEQELMQGYTIKDLASPYINTMSQLLEINEVDVGLDDGMIKEVMQAGGNGERVPLWEFEKRVRSDARWDQTDNAREQASGFASKLLQKFGFQAGSF